MTGYEQVRSVVAALDGDFEAADRVDLVLPETGVCNGAGAFDDPDAAAALAGSGGGGCCGPAAAPEPQLVTLGRPGQYNPAASAETAPTSGARPAARRADGAGLRRVVAVLRHRPDRLVGRPVLRLRGPAVVDQRRHRLVQCRGRGRLLAGPVLLWRRGLWVGRHIDAYGPAW